MQVESSGARFTGELIGDGESSGVRFTGELTGEGGVVRSEVYRLAQEMGQSSGVRFTCENPPALRWIFYNGGFGQIHPSRAGLEFPVVIDCLDQ